MAINANHIHDIAYEPGSLAVPPLGTRNGPVYFAYDWASIRCDAVLDPKNLRKAREIKLAANPAGDTIYLPYGLGQIHSVYIPAPIYAPAGAVLPTGFLTAGMSGCKLFVDTVTTGIIVHHANAGFGSLHGLANARADTENAALNNALAALHANALAWYTAAPHNLVLQGPQRSMGRATYSAGAVAEEDRKAAQGRVNSWAANAPNPFIPDFFGGTTVIGERNGGHWTFHWQTSGDCSYLRPKNFWKPWKATMKGVADVRYKVVGHGQIYP
ncbi:MAG: hypothetical protein ABW067_12410 [Rhizobacter sp.]